MEKVNNAHSSVVVSKTKDGYEKIILNLSLKSLFGLICCFVFSSASMFSSMTPFGVAFYGAIFCKSSWIAPFLVSCFACVITKNGNVMLNLAVFTLVTAVLGIFDTENRQTQRAIIVSVLFFLLKLVFLIFRQFIVYDIFGLILESAVVFALVFVFQNGFPVITSLEKRSFISTSEGICTMTFLALGVMALSDYPPLWGFDISGTLAVLMIYIFSLGGVNGGALVLSVLMGAIGSFASDSFATVTGSYAFGALMASALCNHGKIAVVLGFVIANTLSFLMLADAPDVAVNIYDSLFAGVIFIFLPKKYCRYLSGIVTKNNRVNSCSDYLAGRSQSLIVSRLEEMSKGLDDLSKIYDNTMAHRELGKDYIISRFNEVRKTACRGCVGNSVCFGTNTSIGYANMSKMLETAFKNGKVTPHTMPKELRNVCKRCDSLCEKFNAVFQIIKTERLWLSKLNQSRQLVSCQLHAVGDALKSEAVKCRKMTDLSLEEKLMAEFDKSGITVSDVSAQKDEYGDFLIDIFVEDDEITDEKCRRLQKAVSHSLERDVCCSYPGYSGNCSVISFFPPKNYKVNAGFSSKTKNGEKQSGDSFRLINYDGNNYYAVLSDGMGSGNGAREESLEAVLLMEKFIKAGFDSDIAVKLINSSLLLKSSRDSFSTLDICKVNLTEGTISFTKLGAARSYIKKDDCVTCVNSSSLPAGILRNIEAESHYMSIDSDTVVVLVSDGVADIELKNNMHEGWLEEELKNLKTSNPQIIASKLCSRARSLQQGNISDDMTVIVLNIKKV